MYKKLHFRARFGSIGANISYLEVLNIGALGDFQLEIGLLNGILT